MVCRLELFLWVGTIQVGLRNIQEKLRLDKMGIDHDPDFKITGLEKGVNKGEGLIRMKGLFIFMEQAMNGLWPAGFTWMYTDA